MTATHVVVVGHGMAGARLVEEVRRHDPDARRVRLTVLAAEPRPAYNRILLPSLLSGSMTEGDLTLNGQGWLHRNHVALRTGTPATALDLERQVISTAVGERLRYDALVLATGARPSPPGLPGLSVSRGDAPLAGEHPRTPDGPSRLAAGRVLDRAAGAAGRYRRPGENATVLHSLADARRLAALARAARRTHGRIVVLGGGVLGLEAARALAARGTAVTVVHHGDHPMDRQLDAPGGRVLATALRRTGVDLRLGARAARWEAGRGLWLADGELVRCTGLLLATGFVPETSLARATGLRLTEGGAVAIDDALATSDPSVYAIGDCAGHPGAAGGLVQPGWEQAGVLASRLTGADPKARYRGTGSVTRLKAAGIEVTCAGLPFAEPDEPGYEVLRFEDPARERYAKLVLAGDRVVGAILIGLPDAAARIVQLYDRRAAAPADRLALLLGRAQRSGSETGPAALPDDAMVCRCNMVTKAQLRSAWNAGADSRDALSCATRAATGCGTCRDDLDALVASLARADPMPAAAGAE